MDINYILNFNNYLKSKVVCHIIIIQKISFVTRRLSEVPGLIKTEEITRRLSEVPGLIKTEEILK